MNSNFFQFSSIQKYLLSFLSAFIYILIFPSWNFGLLAWLFLIPLFHISEKLSHKKIFFLWGLTGVVAHMGIYYWIYPTMRLGGVNFFVSGLAVFLLAVYLSFYWAFFGTFFFYTQKIPKFMQPLLWAFGWCALEFIRAHFLSGFPWLLLAYSQWKHPSLIALSEIGGPYFVSFLVVLGNGVLYKLGKNYFTHGTVLKKNLMVPGVALMGLLLLSGALSVRPLKTAGPPIHTAILQGNIDQYKKWSESYEREIVEVYSSLSKEAGEKKVEFMVWPETSVPGWIPNESEYMMWLKNLSRDVQSFLLIGAVSRQSHKDYNAAFLFAPSGDLLSQYLKQHLVPFGEYVPFKAVLSKMIGVLNNLGEFDSGEKNTVIKLKNFHFGVNICFEDLFPNLVRQFVNNGAQMGINITNDGWYRDTAAPEQHFIVNIFRAVETRTWVLRAANTGISGFISPHGKVITKSKLLEKEILYGRPQPMGTKTIYTRVGDLFSWISLLIVFGALIFIVRKNYSLPGETLS